MRYKLLYELYTSPWQNSISIAHQILIVYKKHKVIKILKELNTQYNIWTWLYHSDLYEMQVAMPKAREKADLEP